MAYSNSNEWGALQPCWINLQGASPDDYIYVTDYGTKITSQNGNNGKKMNGFLKGSTGIDAQFHISFKLGYQWGWSIFYMANVKAISSTTGVVTAGDWNTSGYNGMGFWNNNSNNKLYVDKSVSGTSTRILDTTGINDTKIDLWRESDNGVFYRITGGNAVEVGTFTDDFCFYSIAQSPHSVEILTAYNVSRKIS